MGFKLALRDLESLESVLGLEWVASEKLRVVGEVDPWGGGQGLSWLTPRKLEDYSGQQRVSPGRRLFLKHIKSCISRTPLIVE